MERFNILKIKSDYADYVVLDTTTKDVVFAENLREAKQVKTDIERIIFEDKIVDEAMTNPKVLE